MALIGSARLRWAGLDGLIVASGEARYGPGNTPSVISGGYFFSGVGGGL